MTSIIDTLKVKGGPAPKNQGQTAPASAPLRPPKNNNATSFERTYQFVFKQTNLAGEMSVGNYPYQSVPSRRMEHLSRVRAANYGISTMDSSFNYYGEKDSQFYMEKPHFVLCGLPMGSKDIDHHLYVNETRVGNFKTSAKALYQARRSVKSGSMMRESSDEKPEDRPNTSADDELGVSSVPPIPPTTPISPVKLATTPMLKQRPETGSSGPVTKTTGIKTNDVDDPSAKLLVKHTKMTLLSREKASDNAQVAREHSSISTRSSRSILTVQDSVVTNSLTVTTGKRQKNSHRGRNAVKVNYNNPYRNTKYKERMSLSGHERHEFDNIDSYLQYQKKQSNNGKHILTPRAILRIPNPCSDTFLLQMMCDRNRPHSLRSGLMSSKVTDMSRSHDIEEMIQSRASSSISKTNSNIDRFLGRKINKSAKSSKSAKSFKSAIDGETIEEEAWDEGIDMDD